MIQSNTKQRQTFKSLSCAQKHNAVIGGWLTEKHRKAAVAAARHATWNNLDWWEEFRE